MKKITFAILLACAAITLVFGCSKGYESRKSSGDLTITLSIERYPLVKGDNALNVQVLDASGKPVTDAMVIVRYYMPSMPGMAPMEYSTQAMLKGNAYSFSANVPMEGGWKADVSVARPGKPVSMATFNIDAR
jgi:hypothetical protein